MSRFLATCQRLSKARLASDSSLLVHAFLKLASNCSYWLRYSAVIWGPSAWAQPTATRAATIVRSLIVLLIILSVQHHHKSASSRRAALERNYFGRLLRPTDTTSARRQPVVGAPMSAVYCNKVTVRRDTWEGAYLLSAKHIHTSPVSPDRAFVRIWPAAKRKVSSSSGPDCSLMNQQVAAGQASWDVCPRGGL